ncbi:hypothetical protein ACFX14_032038 [Malus domestica]
MHHNLTWASTYKSSNGSPSSATPFSISAPTLPLASAPARPSLSTGGLLTYKEAQLLKSQGLERVKVFDSDPVVIQALVGSDITVTVDLLLCSTPVFECRNYSLPLP